VEIKNVFDEYFLTQKHQFVKRETATFLCQGCCFFKNDNCELRADVKLCQKWIFKTTELKVLILTKEEKVS